VEDFEESNEPSVQLPPVTQEGDVTDGTHRSLLPVSSWRLNFWGGVPIVRSREYSWEILVG
jgi:hypothetical protein